MTLRKRIEYHPSFDDVERAVQAIDPALFLVRTRNGQTIFAVMDPTSGMPIHKELLCVFRKGEGRPDWINGGSLPSFGQVSIGPDGWGIVGVEYSDDDEVLIPAVIAASHRLLAEIETQATV